MGKVLVEERVGAVYAVGSFVAHVLIQRRRHMVVASGFEYSVRSRSHPFQMVGDIGVNFVVSVRFRWCGERGAVLVQGCVRPFGTGGCTEITFLGGPTRTPKSFFGKC